MSLEVKIVVDAHASDDKRRVITEGVDLHNVAATGYDAYHPIAVFLETEAGEVLGGVTGGVWGGWLRVDFVWVAEVLRGRGHARALMQAAEQHALERGAVASQLSTFSF